jgi:iron(III) transport system ATP-binding protein
LINLLCRLRDGYVTINSLVEPRPSHCRQFVIELGYAHAMTTISLDALSKHFDGAPAVHDVSLTFPQGSFTALLGPSGCGKTTLLRLIAGFERPGAGTVRFDGAVVAEAHHMVPPERRRLGIVFQSYALWPHMDVAGNVAYPLRAQRTGRAEIDRRVDEALAVVGLQSLAGRSIDALSGGQRQRVALARCLVNGTDVILLDEPLANLDVHLRASMLDVFADIHKRTGATIIYVTHDQAEALALADQIAVLDHGVVQQVASPTDLYAQPANGMVAGFVGRGNLVNARADNGRVWVGDMPISVRGAAQGSGAVTVLLRPEGLRLSDQGITARVERTHFLGAVFASRLRLEDGQILTLDSTQRPAEGSIVHVAVDDGWIVPR